MLKDSRFVLLKKLKKKFVLKNSKTFFQGLEKSLKKNFFQFFLYREFQFFCEILDVTPNIL